MLTQEKWKQALRGGGALLCRSFNCQYYHYLRSHFWQMEKIFQQFSLRLLYILKELESAFMTLSPGHI